MTASVGSRWSPPTHPAARSAECSPPGCTPAAGNGYATCRWPVRWSWFGSSAAGSATRPGPGLARRYTASGGRVQELTPLAGDTYEAWVAGRDPDSGEPRGRLRNDDQAVRFVEVVVNGPKSWSLAGSPAPRAATRTSVLCRLAGIRFSV